MSRRCSAHPGRSHLRCRLGLPVIVCRGRCREQGSRKRPLRCARRHDRGVAEIHRRLEPGPALVESPAGGRRSLQEAGDFTTERQREDPRGRADPGAGPGRGAGENRRAGAACQAGRCDGAGPARSHARSSREARPEGHAPRGPVGGLGESRRARRRHGRSRIRQAGRAPEAVFQ